MDSVAHVKHVYVSSLHTHVGEQVVLKGWVYNKRDSKGLAFIELRDGSGLVQCVVSEAEVDQDVWTSSQLLTQETSLTVTGTVAEDERQIGGVEVQVAGLEIVGMSEDYPITPKEHGVDFLMNNRHLWLRSRRQWAIMRIRNQVIMSIHNLFQEQGFVQMDAPVLTGNAVEGTSTLFEMDYFDEKAYLTQSGQLYGEAMAMAMGKIYTFGPTFRAEKSKTRRHLTEFWMIEPEMAFYDLDMNMDLAEDLIVRIVSDVLKNCSVELDVLERDREPLERVTKGFPRISYTEAVDLLRSDKTAGMFDKMENDLADEEKALNEELSENKSRYGQAKKWEKRKFDAREIEITKRLSDIEEDRRNLPNWKQSATEFEWGGDFGGSDETVLTWHFDKPIIVHRFPADIKAFYMKRDESDDRLALGIDVLAPEGYGEIVGGGERATDIDFLMRQVRDHNLPAEVFQWYFDLRRFGSVPHSGFGIGLERTITWICKLPHLREAIPFPRLMGRLNP
ncbi:MAG: asparagine--tRNA ligase [Rhodothermales bacterium]|nr:asparagine--tRNA ligase [Rhodothermales bacterium]